jgi:hypothetical protein
LVYKEVLFSSYPVRFEHFCISQLLPGLGIVAVPIKWWHFFWEQSVNALALAPASGSEQILRQSRLCLRDKSSVDPVMLLHFSTQFFQVQSSGKNAVSGHSGEF